MTDVVHRLSQGSEFSWQLAFLTLTVALLAGLYVFAVYRYTAKKAFYSRDLNITLAGITVVTAAIMIAMQSNLVVSLGMVGALSIVRFRTAIKSPLDLLFLFWAISAGIISGVGLYLFCFLLCIAMTALILILQLLPDSKASYVLMVRLKKEVESSAVEKVLVDKCAYYKERSGIARGDDLELIYEVKPKKGINLVKELNRSLKAQQISLVSYDGDYREV